MPALIPPLIRADADLQVEIDRGEANPVHARVHGAANRFTMEIDQPGAFAGAGDAPAVRQVAEGLASLGVVVRVEHDGQHLVTIGAVRAPWWHRRVTGSRRIRLGSLRGVLTSAKARARGTESMLPGSGMVPPPTLKPLFPTVQLKARRPTAYTHAPDGSGGPRLVLAWDYLLGDEKPPTYWLGERTVIGSDDDCDVVLPGLRGKHAVVEHVDGDEYAVTTIGGDTRVHGAGAAGQTLRTGARLEVGEHVLVYYREEYADHGRPFGGRLGGELGRQVPQPSREELLSPPDPPPGE